MSDLISRSAVIEVLKQTGIIQDNDLGHLVVDEINRIPTAYDVEKVVAELDAYITKIVGRNSKLYQTIMEIVKRGGVNE